MKLQKKYPRILPTTIHFIFYSGVGMGKTHLLNAIGLTLKQKSKVMFISAERFMYQFVRSINQMKWLSLRSISEILMYC